MNHLDEYNTLFESLKIIVRDVNNKSLLSDSDPFFLDNINFFSKSFLVTICAYLESFIKDIAYSTIQEYNHRLDGLGIPTNLTKWSFNTKDKIKENQLQFKELKFNIKKKDLENYVSGNPDKTIKLFTQIGIDLTKSDEFNDLKEIINNMIIKRNLILHYNDTASDITLSDILDYIEVTQKYIDIIDSEIQKTLEDYSYQTIN